MGTWTSWRRMSREAERMLWGAFKKRNNKLQSVGISWSGLQVRYSGKRPPQSWRISKRNKIYIWLYPVLVSETIGLWGAPESTTHLMHGPCPRFHQRLTCAQSCPTLCDPMDCITPGSSVHGISQQEYWSGLPFPPSGDLPDPGIETRLRLFLSPCIDRQTQPLLHLGSPISTKLLPKYFQG